MADAAEVEALLDDLAAEEDALDAVVAELTEEQWRAPTPAAGWDVRDEITHLAWVEEAAGLAATDGAAFNDTFLKAAMEDPDFEDRLMARGRASSGGEVLAWWRDERTMALAALRAVAPGKRLPWFGPPMSVRSFVTARLMETWAHGQDVVDALGVRRPPTDRLRHVAHLGVSTRGWSYSVRGMAPDERPVRVTLAAPSGETWQWGPDDAADTITGGALDFCLVVTQRRHWEDTGLQVAGPAATEWMQLAQAFAGRATQAERGRQP